MSATVVCFSVVSSYLSFPRERGTCLRYAQVSFNDASARGCSCLLSMGQELFFRFAAACAATRRLPSPRRGHLMQSWIHFSSYSILVIYGLGVLFVKRVFHGAFYACHVLEGIYRRSPLLFIKDSWVYGSLLIFQGGRLVIAFYRGLFLVAGASRVLVVVGRKVVFFRDFFCVSLLMAVEGTRP